jgi:hypothetical protein
MVKSIRVGDVFKGKVAAPDHDVSELRLHVTIGAPVYFPEFLHAVLYRNPLKIQHGENHLLLWCIEQPSTKLRPSRAKSIAYHPHPYPPPSRGRKFWKGGSIADPERVSVYLSQSSQRPRAIRITKARK